MVELEVHNFQSVRHAKLTVNGFVAVVGRSNIGKSALVRAVYAALTGASGTDFVRHGSTCDRRVRGTKKCKCSAKVCVRSDRYELTWEKGDNVNCYTVQRPGEDPKVYDGLDRGVTPEFLEGDFNPVKIGQKRELIQIPDQFEPIFLLNQSGPAVADVLSDVARLDAINTAMGLANKDRKDASAKRKVREEDVATLRTELSKYDGLDAVPVDELLAKKAACIDLKAKLDRVDGLIQRLASIKVSLVALDAALKPPFPSFDPLDRAHQAYSRVSGYYEALSEKVPVLRQLVSVNEVVVPDDTPLHRTHASLVRVDGFVSRLATLESEVKRLSGVDIVPMPEDPHLDYKSIDRLGVWAQRWDLLSREVEKGAALADVTVPDGTGLAKTFKECEHATSLIERARTLTESMVQITKDLEAAKNNESEIVAKLEAFGICPTCDQPLGGEHRLHMEGA